MKQLISLISLLMLIPVFAGAQQKTYAEKLGFKFIAEKTKDDWAVLKFEKK